MIAAMREWFGARTPREQTLLVLAVFLLVGVGGAFSAYQAASSFRAAAASDLEGASALRADVARLRALAAASPAVQPLVSDGSPRGVATAGADRFGLKVTHVEPAGPTGVRATFAPAPATSIFSWIDAVERAGLVVSRISLVRAGEGDVVAADVIFNPRGS